MNINEAKKKIAEMVLKYPEVNGIGIKEENNEEYIVIYLSQENENIQKEIPEAINGVKVKIEIIGNIKML